MFRKLYYLTSVSVIASMAMNLTAQAMEAPVPEEKSIKSRSRRNAVAQQNNTLSIHEEADRNFNQNISEKGSAVYRIACNVYSGNYDELAGEVIDLLIANLSGEGEALKSLLRPSNKDFDPEVLAKASNVLVNKFLKKLSENPDLYGELPDGTRVTIYNRSFFKKFAEQCFPQIPLVTGVAIKILDNDTLKGYIQKKLIETVYGYFKEYLTNKKEASGHVASKFINSMIYDESSIDFTKVWEYLGPHLTHQLRHYTVSLIKDVKNTQLKEYESSIKKVLLPSTFILSGAATYFANSALYTLGSYANDPILQVAAAVGTYLGTPVIGAYSTAKANYGYYEPIKNQVSQWIDDKLDLWGLTLIPLSREEHVLYGLNYDNPTDIEKGLAFEDYKLFEELNSHTLMGKVINSMVEKSGVQAVYNYFFGRNNSTPDLLQIKYCMNEEQEQAYRRLALLRIENPEEAERIEENLEQYPSYEQKVKALQGSKTTSLDEILQSRHEVIGKIRGVAAILGKELCGQDEQLTSLKDSTYAALLEEILSSSIESQDHIIEWVKNHRTDLKEFVKTFAAKPEFEGFVKQNFVNKKTIKDFVARLMNEGVQEYIETLRKAHIEKYKDSFECFASKPLTEGMDQIQIVHLHKHLMSGKNKSFFEALGPDITSQVLHLLDDKDLIELSIISRKLHKLCLDIVDERKAEKLFVLESLSDEEQQYFTKYRHDILVMEATHRELKLNHLAYTLFKTLENHLEQTKVLEKLEHKCINEYKMQLSLGENTIPTLEEITKKLLQLLAANPHYTEVNDMIRPKKNSVVGLTKIYDIERYRLVEATAKSILKEVNAPKGRNTLRESSQQNVSSGGFSLNPLSYFRGNDHVIDLTQQMVDEKFQKAQKCFEPHDESSRGVRGFNLLSIIKAMKFEDHSQLSLKDFIVIHQNILRSKLTKANEFDKNYIGTYGVEEVYSYKFESPVYSDQLFFGYAELIETIRKQNREFLKKLFNIQERL